MSLSTNSPCNVVKSHPSQISKKGKWRHPKSVILEMKPRLGASFCKPTIVIYTTYVHPPYSQTPTPFCRQPQPQATCLIHGAIWPSEMALAILAPGLHGSGDCVISRSLTRSNGKKNCESFVFFFETVNLGILRLLRDPLPVKFTAKRNFRTRDSIENDSPFYHWKR